MRPKLQVVLRRCLGAVERLACRIQARADARNVGGGDVDQNQWEVSREVEEACTLKSHTEPDRQSFLLVVEVVVGELCPAKTVGDAGGLAG